MKVPVSPREGSVGELTYPIAIHLGKAPSTWGY
jgi:hypothetical protein